MSGLEIGAVVGIAAWLGVLTLVLVLVIRQVTLVTARVDRASPVPILGLPDDGPTIGAPLPDAVVQEVPQLAAGVAHLVLLSATCNPCREMAEQMRAEHFPPGEKLIALVPGREHLADGVIAMLPQSFRAIRDPMATEVAGLLQLETVPFAMTARDGVVAAKAPILTSIDDLTRFRGVANSRVNGHRSSPREEGEFHASRT